MMKKALERVSEASGTFDEKGMWENVEYRPYSG